jgi:hypothetical protein
MYHFDEWKSKAPKMAAFLDENASEEEFDKLDSNISRLENIITNDTKDVFNSKESFIFLTLFDRFTGLGREDVDFVQFLRKFKTEYKNNRRNSKGLLFDDIDNAGSTKDKSVILAKLDMLTKLLLEFLHIEETDLEDVDTYDFVKEVVSKDLTKDDVNQFEEVLDDLTLNVDNSSKLLDKHNRPTLVALVAYSFQNDIDLDGWIIDYFYRNNTYIMNAKQNFLHMKEDLEKYMNKGVAA